MLVFFLLQRLCLLLLPWTAVARPASPGSSGGVLEVRESHKGLERYGKAGRDVSVTRRAEDAVTALAASRRAPKLLHRDHPGNVKAPSPFMAEPLSNTTALVSGKIEMLPFDFKVGPLEVRPRQLSIPQSPFKYVNPPSSSSPSIVPILTLQDHQLILSSSSPTGRRLHRPRQSRR